MFHVWVVRGRIVPFCGQVGGLIIEEHQARVPDRSWRVEGRQWRVPNWSVPGYGWCVPSVPVALCWASVPCSTAVFPRVPTAVNHIKDSATFTSLVIFSNFTSLLIFPGNITSSLFLTKSWINLWKCSKTCILILKIRVKWFPVKIRTWNQHR